jgi:hypothetical protein
MHRDLVVSDAFLRPNPGLFHAKARLEAITSRPLLGGGRRAHLNLCGLDLSMRIQD